MSILLRITAVVSLAWAISLFSHWSLAGIDPGAAPLAMAWAHGLAIAHCGFAYLFWRAAGNPRAERGAIYTALLVLGLRAANGTYEMLYLLEGRAAIVSLIDMTVSTALFVGVLNTLPSTLRAGMTDSSGPRGSDSSAP